jgi:hypothetical protein
VKRALHGASAQTLERPNIVFVLTDDQFPGTQNKIPALKRATSWARV